jgi:phage regulator Rha-like protein
METKTGNIGGVFPISSRKIAKRLGRRHDQITKLMTAYSYQFGSLETARVDTGGRPTTEYFLNKKQTVFLIGLMQNSKETVEFMNEILKEV